MSDDEFRERMAAALTPLVTYLAETVIPAAERYLAAYDAWGINRLEALANGYIDAEDQP